MSFKIVKTVIIMFDRGAESGVGRTQERRWLSMWILAHHHQRGAEGELRGLLVGHARNGARREIGNGSHGVRDGILVFIDKILTPSASTEELQVLTDVSQAIQVETVEPRQAYSLFQESSSASLQTTRDLEGLEVVTLIRRLSKQEHTAALDQLTLRISAIMKFGAGTGEDPCARVKGLIKGLISRLQGAASSEAKAYFRISKPTLRSDHPNLKQLSLSYSTARSLRLSQDWMHCQTGSCRWIPYV